MPTAFPLTSKLVSTALAGPLLLGTLLLGTLLLGTANASDPNQASEVQSDLDVAKPLNNDQIIRQLIEKLGSESYATRIRARDQLKAYGLEAFDALQEAQEHDDSEILSAARYLTGSLHVSWTKDSDPREVREILFEYGAQSETQRLGRIELLGNLSGQTGTEALARLARFDGEPALRRRAAMLILRRPTKLGGADRERLADKIEQVIGENQRDSSEWLLAYAADLREGKYNPGRWKPLVAEQRMKLDEGSSVEITSASVMQLIRELATRALDEGAKKPATDLVLEHIDLVSPTTLDLADQSNWLIRKQLFPVVVALYDRHQHTFGENAELLYSAAQAIDEMGDAKAADAVALMALKINPLPELVADKDAPKKDLQNKLTEHQLNEIAISHQQVASMLIQRGRFDWAERENREVIRHCGIESGVGILARRQLAALYGELLRHREAEQTLFPIVDRSKKDRDYVARLGRLRVNLGNFNSTYQYELGCALQEEKESTRENLKAVKTCFKLAYRYDPENIDILIRMYRLDDPNDSDWAPSVMEQIVQKREAIATHIRNIEARRGTRAAGDPDGVLGEDYNQYAWLVANTEGDFEKALQYSKSSVKFLDSRDFRMRAARLDTCARCYFALGQVEKAIETQNEAIAIEPHSPPMLRQLAEFEAAL